MSSYTRAFCALLILSCACAGNASDGAEADGIDDSFLAPEGAADAWGVTEGSPEAKGVLRAANELTLDQLTNEVPEQAAEAIADHRAGKDGNLGTADDVTIQTLTELDAIPYVGPIAFARLRAYATAQGWVTSGEGESIDPLADADLARVVVVYPKVNGAAVQTPVYVDTGVVAEQKTEDMHVFDLDPKTNPCVHLNGYNGFKRCELGIQAGKETRIELAAVYVGDLTEVGETNAGKVNTFTVQLSCDDANCGGAETFNNGTGGTGQYHAWFAGNYEVTSTFTWLPTKPAVIEAGKTYKNSIIPDEDYRAFVWRVADPKVLPDAAPSPATESQELMATTYKEGSTFPHGTYETYLPVWAAAEAGHDRTADPILMFPQDAADGTALRVRTFTGRCRIPYDFPAPAIGESVTVRTRRLEVQEVTVKDASAPNGKRVIPGKYWITPLDDPEQELQDECPSQYDQAWRGGFNTGTGLDVPPGRYRVTVTSKPLSTTVTKEYEVDLR